MNMVLTRNDYTIDGIFGNWEDEAGAALFANVEHSYKCVPKVAPGTYVCKRMAATKKIPYEHFCIMDVPDFEGVPVDGIAIHIGNFDRDSEGCSCIGLARQGFMVVGSKLAFDQFMALHKGQNEFTLVIR